MNALFVAWQDPTDRHWRPVARLTFTNNRYLFVYTKGAVSAKNFMPFGRMTDLNLIYESNELFPLFRNRLLPKNRPEYRDFLRWLNIQEEKDDPIVILSRSGGTRGTDSLVIFPCPQPSPDGKYLLHFFSQGLRYLKKEDLDAVSKLQIGEQLYLMLDVQNEYDSFAIALRSGSPPVLLGYVPRYFAEDFRKLLENKKESVKVVVERVNQDAPVQLRLLCKITAEWPKIFQPCSSELYEPMVDLADHVPLQKEALSFK